MTEYSKFLWADSIFILLTAISPAPMTVLKNLLNEFIHEHSRIWHRKVVIIPYTFVNIVLYKLPAPRGQALYFFLALEYYC